MTIITRASKGSALTWAEEDNNFTELNNRTKVQYRTLQGNIQVFGLADSPSLTVFNGLVALPEFVPDTIKTVSVGWMLPKDYVPGTAIYPHLRVAAEEATSGTIRWGFAMQWANTYSKADADALIPPTTEMHYGASTTFYVQNVKTAVDALLSRIVLFADGVTLNGILPDATIICKVWRDATHVNDTYPSSVFMVASALYYQSNSTGTTNPE